MYIKKQNPSLDGFQFIIMSFKFQMEPKRIPVIQILNINNNHWITISTIIGVPTSTVKVHGSNHGQLPHHEQKLVADMLQSCQPDIVIHYIDVQKQANTSYCGLFSSNCTNFWSRSCHDISDHTATHHRNLFIVFAISLHDTMFLL